ncbi:hypothetical protein LIER_24756 [Lithospermum erythrorhizon]|uniref:Uncharacterized protein n=1 Tax=Lithospermum erythrorhizon TaxID=34254 RepID=A0AAV3R5I8_LITER
MKRSSRTELNLMLLLTFTTFILCCSDDVAVAKAPAPTPALGEPMYIMTALQMVLRSLRNILLNYVSWLTIVTNRIILKLVKALCDHHNVSLITVPSAKTRGEWAGVS